MPIYFIKEIQYKINRRPREKINFSTQKKKFFNLVLYLLYLPIDSAVGK
ncbi:hypothetical protein TFKS16_2169 [Tannerella forsythia KS16]|uniref:Uncharacterized protein n=1 Tax=Tannerella forsythia (strain ATCC 43037 / JCM 10827 / CCUG 21028 A / KCTC 5666 / FDC 338) TaxID=203275 RepID=G8UKT1_TANFA|nr:hypothetical protein BFO_2518 [Tannerella forsythia 92A2]BAR49650.1 hypothetical protein TF3313_2193 [Tannerella forsythia 3313]BAR52372.1 hypothetical protein TFKS16_2169 [Tannerella forsythia KS16]